MNNGPKIYKVGEQILATPAEPVSTEEFDSGKLQALADELNSIALKMGAVGFSAPQIGHSKRIMFIGMQFDNPRRPNVRQFPNMTFVNPEINGATLRKTLF